MIERLRLDAVPGGDQEVTGSLTPSREPVLDLMTDGITAADARAPASGG